MLLTNWLSNFSQKSSSRRLSARHHNRLAAVSQNRRKQEFRFRASTAESLEDRALLAAFVVNTIEDGSTVADGAISLREAITAANANAPYLDAPAGDTGVDTITFDPSLSGLTITLSGTSLTITDDLTISDGNALPLTVHGNDASRVFEVGAGAGTVSISDITISGGNADRGAGLFVNNGQTLTLADVTVSGNTATGTAATDGGGGIYNSGGALNIMGSTITANSATGTSGSGGGIFSTDGTINIATTTINANAANRAGGGIELIEGTAVLTTVNLINNDVDLVTANPGNGGGVHITGAADFTMDGGSVFGNLAGREGGGLWNGTGTMTIRNGTLIQGNEAGGNAADDGGGGIFNNGGTLIVDGSTATVQIVSNVAFGTEGSGGAIFNAAGGTVTINDAVITGNEAERAGGGIEDASGVAGVNGLALNNVMLDSNIAHGTDATAPGNGGGLHISGAGNVTIHGGTISNNTAASEGGGLWNATGVMTITNGTFINGNTAQGAAANEGGGGIFNNGGTLIIDGSAGLITISNNTTTGTTGSGGGIFSTDGDVTITSANISMNSANRAGGGIELIEGTAVLTTVNLINNDVDLVTANPGNGGGVHITGAADFTMDGGSVFGNLAGREGGGLWNGTGTMTIRNGTLIQGNEAGGNAADDGGGGIFNNGGTLIVDGSTATVQITDNLAFGAAGSGGGIFSTGGTITISDALIDGNSANRAGGGLEIAGGTITISDTDLTNNDVDNVASGTPSPGNGGGLHISGFADVSFVNGEVSGNAAANEGGGLWNSSVGILNVNGTLVENNTSVNGGGIYTQGNALATVRVTLTNLAPDGGPTNSGLFLTPTFTAFHDGTFDIFDPASAASAELERVAEDGNTGPLTTAFTTAQPNGVNATFPSALTPGATQQMVFGVDPATNRYFSFASMVIPSNDAFIGNGDPFANELFDASGAFNGTLTFTVAGSQVWDAGTEVNNEVNAAFFDQTAADEGTIESSSVALHPGFIDSVGNPGATAIILGGTQSVGPLRTFGTTNADFTTANYNLLQVTIEQVASGTTITNATINANTATGNVPGAGGGGVFNDGGKVTITGGSITNNTAVVDFGNGGAILNAAAGTTTVSGTTISRNRANRAGGGIENAGTLNLTTVVLADNRAGVNGGGLHVSGLGTTNIDGGSVTGNSAASEGGGIWNGTGEMNISNGTVIDDNSAAGNGVDQGGGGVFNAGGAINISDAVISNNIASGGTTFTLGGDQEVPAVITNANGSADFQYNAINNTFDLQLFVSGIELADTTALPELTGAHIHLEDAGTNGPVIVNLLDHGNFLAVDGGILLILNDTAFPIANEAALFTGGTYINVHSSDNVGGEVRGQIAFPTTMGSGGGILNDQGTVTISGTSITGNIASRAGGGIESNVGTVSLTNVNLDSNIAGVSGRGTPGNGGGLHVTGGGGVTVTGGTVIGNRSASEGGGLWNGTGTMNISGGAVISTNTANGTQADQGGAGVFNAGGTVNIDGVIISNNTTVGTTVVALSGDQEVPAVTTSAAGTADFQYNPSTGTFDLDLFVTGIDLADVTGAHVHVGTAGANGPVIVNLTNLTSFAADGGGIRLTLDDVAFPAANAEALLASGTYLNVHSTSNGGGEVRGQITYSVSSGSGGGILNDQGTVTAVNTSIIGNTAVRAGGGIETVGGSVSLTNVNLDDNAAGPAGAANPGNGGGLHTSAAGVVTINGGTVSRNTAASEGGGLWNSVAGRLTIDGTTINGNTAANGGGIFNDAANGVSTQQFTLNITELNGSGVTGTGSVTLNQPTVTTREIRVVINATGMEDLTSFGGFHVAHIHGQFAGNRIRPLLAQGDGPFFEGAGGAANGFSPVNSILPSVAANDGLTIADGFLDFLEGRPQYGPVLLNLTSTQMRDAGTHGTNPPDGTPPLAHFLNLFTNGDIDPTSLFPQGTEFVLDTTYTFDLTNADEARQFNNLAPLDLREIVIHGASIDKAISDAIDVAAMGTAPEGTDLGNGMAFRVTAPVAAAEIVAASGVTAISNSAISNNTATANGGGILNETGALDIADSTITGNMSGGDAPGEGGGGIFNDGTLNVTGGIIGNNNAVTGLGNGGGLLNAANGTAGINGTIVSGNAAARAGGGIESAGSLVISEIQLMNNFAGINGGGLHVSGPATTEVIGGNVTGNTAAQEGGGLWNGSGVMTVSGRTVISGNSAGGSGADQGGGGIFNAGGTLDVSSSTISNNLASGGTSVTLDGGQEVPAVTTTAIGSANLQFNAVNDTFDIRLFITDLELSDVTGAHIHVGAATENGAVIVNLLDSAPFVEFNGGLLLSLDDITFPAANEAALLSGGTYLNVHTTSNSGGEIRGQITFPATMGSGGGIFNDQGTVTVTETSIIGNIASRAGGGIETNMGDVNLMRTTLATNIAGPVNAATPGNGGAVHISGAGTVSLHNSTVSANTAANEGGGLWNSGGGMLTVRNATIVANNADITSNGGGAFTVAGGTTSLVNTIVAGNTSGSTRAADDIQGPIDMANSTNNLIADAATSGGLTDSTSGNIVGLGGTGTRPLTTVLNTLLADNGGSTQTHAVIVGSVAIDAGVDLTALGIATDQAGQSRPLGSAFDIGAVEFDATAKDETQISITGPGPVAEGQAAVFTVSLDRIPSSTVTVTVTATSDSAISGSDFLPLTPQTLTFEPGQALSQTVTISTIDDSHTEPQETFSVALTEATGAVLSVGQATGIINDNDNIGTPLLDAVPRFPSSLRPKLTWQGVDTAVNYEIWLTRRFPGEARIFLNDTMSGTTSFTPPADLDPGFYRYWVRAFNVSGSAGPWSLDNTFEIRPTLVSPVTPTFDARPDFQWNAIPNAPGYEIFIRTVSGDIVATDITGTSYTPTMDLAPGPIRWWIRSSDAIGNRGYSRPGETGIRTTITAPNGPAGSNTPTITWVPVAGAGRYVLYVQNRDTGALQFRQDFLRTTSFTPESPLPSGNYRAWVKAIDGDTNLFTSGQWSAFVDFSVTANVNSDRNEHTDTQALTDLTSSDVRVGMTTDAQPATRDAASVDSGRALARQSKTQETEVTCSDDESSFKGDPIDVSRWMNYSPLPDAQPAALSLLDEWMANPAQVAALLQS